MAPDPLDADPRTIRLREWSARHPYGDLLTEDDLADGFAFVFGRRPAPEDPTWHDWREWARRNHDPADGSTGAN